MRFDMIDVCLVPVFFKFGQRTIILDLVIRPLDLIP